MGYCCDAAPSRVEVNVQGSTIAIRPGIPAVRVQTTALSTGQIGQSSLHMYSEPDESLVPFFVRVLLYRVEVHRPPALAPNDAAIILKSRESGSLFLPGNMDQFRSARQIAGRAPRSQTLKRHRFSSSLRGTRLGVRSGAGIGNLIGEQGHHGGEVGLLEALDQGHLRVDEGGEELLGYGLVGADEPSKAAGVLHLVNGLLLGLLCLVSSGLRLAEFLLGLFSSILGGCELLVQLLNSTFGRGDLLLKRHNLLLSDAL
nr:hypothetical protein Iba_chr11bCG9380 [Ipomoea batatas]